MFDDPFTSHLRAVREALVREVEKLCEMSLVDEKQRGVLIVQNTYGGFIEGRLTEAVPYGHIHYVQEGTDLARLVPPPTEGGGTT